MTELSSEEWYETATEMIQFARKRVYVADYQRFSKIAQPIAGRTYIDRMRVLDELLTDGIVRIEDKQLCIGIAGINLKIQMSLIRGEKGAWKFVESFDPSGRLAQKFDYELKKEIGLLGEQKVMEELRSQLSTDFHSRIIHVSLNDDTAGFDILSPSIANRDSNVLLEVKTSSRDSAKFLCYLSSNEMRVAESNKNWHLVLVQIANSIARILGWVELENLSSRMPTNTDEAVSWQSVAVTIEPSWINPGLP